MRDVGVTRGNSFKLFKKRAKEECYGIRLSTCAFLVFIGIHEQLNWMKGWQTVNGLTCCPTPYFLHLNMPVDLF